jgi:hypothetical protein
MAASEGCEATSDDNGNFVLRALNTNDHMRRS